MSKIQKLIERLLSKPTDFTWGELVKLLTYYEYAEVKSSKTGGSRRKFVDDELDIISLHKPHPDQILKRYAIEIVIAHLKDRRKINE